MKNDSLSAKLATVGKVGLILWFVVALYLQHNIGLADNRDFRRYMRLFTRGPVGLEGEASDLTAEQYDLRYGNYYNPYWTLKWQREIPPSSTVALWFPGALLNYLLYSRSVLYATSLSLFPKILLAGVLLLLFKWIDQHDPGRRPLLYLTFGLPFTLLVTATDYVAYFNSFFPETGSFIFLLLFLASLLYASQARGSHWRLSLSLALLFLLSAAKLSNIYWLWAIFPCLYLILSDGSHRRTPRLILAGALLTLFMGGLSVAVTGRGYVRNNPYHSLFYGVLTFSNDPVARLKELGLEVRMECVGQNSFVGVGPACFSQYKDRMTHFNSVRVILREPMIFPRMLQYAMDSMQVVTVDFLGKYALQDPKSAQPFQSDSPLNLWVMVKQRFFPKGTALLICLLLLAVIFLGGIRQGGALRDISMVGLIVTVACVLDMTVAILGEGRADLAKHLFLANALFDLAAIAGLTVTSQLALSARKILTSGWDKDPWFKAPFGLHAVIVLFAPRNRWSG